MPPFAGIMTPSSHGFSAKKPESNIITIDVGGQLFQTTKQTLTLAGPNSLFSQFLEPGSIPFIDRDPDLFSILLSLLRTGNLPSKSKNFDLQDLISESKFYGIETLILNSVSNPSQFEAFNLERSKLLQLNGRDSPSAISTMPFGSCHVAHGSKITSFDWDLQRKSTILTELTAVDSLLALSPSIAAIGATDFPGLQIIDLKNGTLKKTLNWENVTKSESTVQSIGSSHEFMFTSFESGRRNSNSIIVYDINLLAPVSEIGHCEIYGADIDSAIPATKLNWVSNHNLLMASGSHSGPSGVMGNIKLWDIRSGKSIWELKEKDDCFSDVTVSDNMSAIFKVGVNSGEVSYIDIRHLDGNNNGKNEKSCSPWVCIGDEGKFVGNKHNNGKKEGHGCKIESHGNQVFSSRGGNLVLWSEVLMGSRKKSEDGLGNRVFRRNLMGRVKDFGGERITNLAFGGNKMFVSRKDEQCVEVWQSSITRF